MNTMLLNSTHMTAAERKAGRFMRAPDHADAGSGGNNQAPVNNGASENSPSQNNNGQQFDPASFWDGGEEGNAGVLQSGESAAPVSQSSSPPRQGQQQDSNPGAGFAEAIRNAKFGQEVMTSEALEAINNNSDLSVFNGNLQQFGQDVMRQTTMLNARILQAVMQQMKTEFQELVSGQLSSRDNDAELLKAIPSANNPALRPMVDSIFKRAMQVTKGNREAAIHMTKEMLRFQTQQLRGDSNLNIAPEQADDRVMGDEIDWVDELVGRGK